MISAYMCTLNQLALYPYPPTPRGWSEVCLAHPPQRHLPNAETFRRLHTSQRCCASRYAPARSIAFGSFPVFARCDARPLYATVLAVAGNAAGRCSGTVLYTCTVLFISSSFHILSGSGLLQSYYLHCLPSCCVVYCLCWPTVYASSSARHALLPADTVSYSPTAFTVFRLSSYRILAVIRSALARIGCAALALRI